MPPVSFFMLNLDKNNKGIPTEVCLYYLSINTIDLVNTSR